MESKLTVEQQLTALASGKTIALGDPAQPGKVLVQASRLGEHYYVTGPASEVYAPEVDLGELFAIGLANGDDHAIVIRLLNQYLGDHGARVLGTGRGPQYAERACDGSYAYNKR